MTAAESPSLLCGLAYTMRALEIVRSYVGVSESGANNRGRYIDEWQREVGLQLAADPTKPGYPWCTAFLYSCFRRAANDLGIVCPFPKTAKAVRVFALADKVCRVSNPGPGVVYVLAHGREYQRQWDHDSYTDDGHIGIIERATTDVGDVDEISGNTFATRGSREGNTVARHHGQPEVTHGGVVLGYIDFALAPTRRL